MSNNFQLITIGDTEYAIVDSIQNLRAEDSFIVTKNKNLAHPARFFYALKLPQICKV